MRRGFPWQALLTLLLGVSVLTLSPAGSSAPTLASGTTAGDDLQGDADCSGAVNPVDGLAVLRHDSGTAAAPCVELADVQCDGDVDPIDALQLLRWDAGLGVSQEEGCAEIGEPVGPPPTSEELIAEALGRGDITYEESLLYRGYALYDHPELPNEFRSEIVDLHAGSELFLEVETNRDQLNEDLLDDLEPMLARPNEPASIFNNPPQRADVAPASSLGWRSSPAAGGMAHAWVRDGPGADNELTEYVVAINRVWNALPGVFRYGLPDTAAVPNADINPNSAIDIYFVDAGSVDPRQQECAIAPPPPKCVFTDNGFAHVAPPNAGLTWSAYLVISTARRGDDLLDTLSHELAHAGQFAYDAYEGNWLQESTATWVAFRAVQKLGASQGYTHDLLPDFFEGLDETLTRETELNEYGSYLYFLFASMEEGDSVVTSIWENAAATGAQNERAADNVFPFDEQFDDFTVTNWNKEPVDPLYRSPPPGDPTFPQGLAPEATNIHFASPDVEQLDIGLEPLSAQYRAFTFDESVRTVIFDNKWVGVGDWHVWALVRIGAEWQAPADWTDEPMKEFCRDRPSADIQELVLIVSNSHMTSSITPPEDAEVKGTGQGCSGWEGSATVVADEFGVNYEATAGGLSFDQNPNPREYSLAAGSLLWTANGTNERDCTVSGELNVNFANESGDVYFEGLLSLYEGGFYTIHVHVATQDEIEHWDCPPANEDFTGSHVWSTSLNLIPATNEFFTLTEENGLRVAEGEFTHVRATGQSTYSWRLVEYGGEE